MKFEQNRIENSEFFFEKTYLREVGFAFFFFAFGFLAQANSTCLSCVSQFLTAIHFKFQGVLFMGGRGVKLGKRVKWVYGRKGTPEGT